MGDVGWRDRDYARFNDEERRRLYGGGVGRTLPPSGGVRQAGVDELPRSSRTPGKAADRSSFASFWLQTVDHPVLSGVGLRLSGCCWTASGS